METAILKLNDSNVKMTNNLGALKAIRIININEAIAFITSNYKESDFTNKKNFISHFIKNNLGAEADVKIDTYTKRAVTVAAKMIIGNYKMKKEELTLAQMEHLLCFDNSKVNALMKSEDYVLACKDLISQAKVSKSTKVFSKAKAGKI